jgi:MoxR-like ATPase
MSQTNVVVWCDIKDDVESLICEFLDIYELFYLFIPDYEWGLIYEDTEFELVAKHQILAWFEKAWTILANSELVNYRTEGEYFQNSFYCIAIFYLYAEYSGLGMIDDENLLHIADFWEINSYNFKQIIDEYYGIITKDEDRNCDFNTEIILLINNMRRDVVIVLENYFGGQLKLSESIRKSIQLDLDLGEYGDKFDRVETEAINEKIKIDRIAEKWEEIEGDEVRQAAIKLAHYFQGEIIDIEEEVKPMINKSDPDFQTNKFKNMKYDTISPKYLFSMDTFDVLTAWKDNLGRQSLAYIIAYYDKIVEYVEEPFNRLCYLVSAKLPSQLSAQPGDAKWNEAELQKNFSQFSLFYIRINPNYITFGYSKEIYRSIFIKVFQSDPDRLKTIINKNREEQHDIMLVSDNECFITKNELIHLSTSQLSNQIAQFFLNHLDMILLATLDEQRTAINDYLHPLVNESKLNSTYTLSKCAEETGFDETQLTRWIDTINRKGQSIIQGPPGTGKTFLAQKLAKHLIGGGDGFSDTIQFHPAYTYEDFIQGIRPQSQDGQLTYPIVPGRFLEFCEKVEACEDTCVLIIDEINRANLSQVFGELMYLLDDRQDTKRFITLASGKQFRIPTNVRIIGTMNTADRSIALVDNALRRRFAFIPLYPNYELLQNYHIREKTGFLVDKLIDILENINRTINNKHYELGISFFLTKTLSEDIQDIWQMEIEPYLEEYFFDDPAKMDEFLWDKIKDKLSN